MTKNTQDIAELSKKTETYGSPSLAGIFKKALSLVGGRVGGNLLTLGYTLLLARIATPMEFGLVMTGFAWAMLLSIGLALNVESGSIKYLVQYHKTDRSGLAAGFIRFNRTTIVVLSGVSALLMGGAWWFGLLDQSGQTTQVLVLAIVAAPVVALTRVYGRHATALGQVLRGGLPIMLVRPAVICALLTAVWLSGRTPGPTLLMLLMLVAFVMTALVQAFLLRKTFAFTRSAAPDYGEAGKWLYTGAMMAPLLVLRDNLKHIVVVSAGLVLNPAEVGYVALAMSVMSLIYFSMKAIDISLSPQLSHALQNHSFERVTQLIKNSAKLKLGALVLGVAIVTLLGKWGLSLFGAAYTAAFYPLLILMLVPAADALFGPAQVVLNVTGRQFAVFWVAGISSVVLVGAIVLGGWLYGASGAVLGAGLSYMLQQALLRQVSAQDAKVETSVKTLLGTKKTKNAQKDQP
ncbi:MAG: lipopolysaccharide biosynthesis protein [Hyphomonas sp.]